MLNLYWKSGGQTRSLSEKSFKSEAEFEKYIDELKPFFIGAYGYISGTQ